MRCDFGRLQECRADARHGREGLQILPVVVERRDVELHAAIEELALEADLVGIEFLGFTGVSPVPNNTACARTSKAPALKPVE